MANDPMAQLTALLPVLRDLNRATRRLAAALPAPGHPRSVEPGSDEAGSDEAGSDEAPTIDEALAEVNAAIDSYCRVTIENSGVL